MVRVTPSHSVGEISFNPFSMPGQADYGNLYIAVGDAFAGGALKNFQHVQDRDNPVRQGAAHQPASEGRRTIFCPFRQSIPGWRSPALTTTTRRKRSLPGACAIPRTSASPGTLETTTA